MKTVSITIRDIEQFRGALTIGDGDLPYSMWQVFDRAAFELMPDCLVVPIARLVSTKDQSLDAKFLAGEKPDPRLTAFERMVAAAKGLIEPRKPIRAVPRSDGTFLVEDGNATAQVLMMAGWKEVPVQLVRERSTNRNPRSG